MIDKPKGRIIMKAPQLGDYCPWGKVDAVTAIEPGEIICVSTPYHGGIWISDAQVAKLSPDTLNSNHLSGGGFLGFKHWWVLSVKVQNGIICVGDCDARVVMSALGYCDPE